MSSRNQQNPAEADLALPGIATSLRALSHAASWLPVVIGSAVLFAWWRDIESIKRLGPGLVAMNPASAVGLIFLGGALALLSTDRPTALGTRFGRGLGLAAAAIGLIKLLTFITLPDLGIDQLLFREKLSTPATLLPNRMAPNTAFNFLLLGSALFLLDRRFPRISWPAQILAVIAGMSSLLALMGYAYGVKSFYGIGSYIPMAVHSAGTFLVIAVGVLSARPTRGIMAVVISKTSGGLMVRRLLPVILVLPLLLGVIRLLGQRANVLDPAFGLWLLVVSIMTVFAVLVAWNGLLLFRADVDRAAAERTLTHQATHDALTQLPNRRLFIQRVQAALDEERLPQASAVLFTDMDLFKVINDSLGHVIGDELLQAAGQRIHETLGDDALVARLSGDEFTVLLTGLRDQQRALDVADRILHAFSQPFALGPHKIFVSVSIGIAFSSPGDLPVNLIRHADIAMYRAKARGKSRYAVFDASMDQEAVQRLQLEIELRRALEEKELRVFYQPEVEISTGRLVGMEALVRWQHPERGLLSPADFIDVAEETGLILPIGRWVLYEACRQAKEWQEKYPQGCALLVSVNLSGKHFQQATLIDEVAETVERTGIDPSHLILEITETVAMAGAESTIEILTRLKALGVLLAIDDFGTGFSSLAYLKRFPVDVLKIDKSFVDGIALQGHDLAIVQAVISLGHALGLTVIAEGVETPEQLERLRALGSELGQGFYFSRPLSDDSTLGMPSLLEFTPHWNR